jgi:hypothetical protein
MEKQDERSLLTLNWSQQGRKVVIFPLYIFASIADMIHFRHEDEHGSPTEVRRPTVRYTAA